MPRRILFSGLFVVSVVLAGVIFWRLAEKSSAPSSQGETSDSQELAPPESSAPTPAQPAIAISKFSAWSDELLNTPAADRTAALLARGAELARDRQAELAELIRNDPQAALEAAVPMAVRQRLPQAIVDQLEERVSGKGFYGVLIATDFEKGTSEIRREVTIGDKTYNAFVYGRRLSQVTQERVPMWGIAVRNPARPNGPALFVPSEDPVRPVESGETIPALDTKPCPVSTLPSDTYGTDAIAEVAGQFEKFCMASHIYKLNDRLAADIGLGGSGDDGPPTAQDNWSQGPKTCLYMRVAFPDDPSEPITEDEAYARMDEVNQWFTEASYDSTQIIPTVTPLLMMPYPKSFYSEQGTGRLLSDSRQAARQQAGLDTDNFNWDIVRHSSVPGFNYGGLGFVRGKGTWLASSSTGVTVHELGHNYGLWHANFWSSSGDSIIGPGSHQEYGNSFDTMGAANAGANHFNAAFKNELDWLPESFIHSVTSNGTYRIYTFDAPGIITGQKYAIRVRKDYDRNYWAEFRQRFSHRWFVSGVSLNWDAWNNGVTNSAGGTHLLDTTPGSPDGKNDAPVVIGRTFSDVPAGVHITPIERGNFGESWIDVTVNIGAFPDNTPPVANLIADRTSVAPNANVNFSITAFDNDGDELAYAWDFGDLNFGPNSPNVAKSWPAAGEYTVRCTVSDMKGGIYTLKTTITVGAPTTFRISGRVTTEAGLALEGVRIHNGQSGAAYRGTFTDSDGYYVLANNTAGSHTVNAVKYGHTLAPQGWANPVAVGPHATNRNFIATSLPVVSIAAEDANASEAASNTGRFVISRTGPTDAPLAVRLNRTGTATLNTDYTLSPAPSGSPLQFTIPAGAASLPVTVTPVGDTSAEGPEIVMITFQHHTTYALGSLAEAVVTIADDESPTIPSIDISASSPSLPADNLATESGSDSATFTFTRGGSLAGELTVHYAVSGSATEGVDFEELSGVITIPSGQNLAVLPFRIIDDIEVENNETVTLTILANPAYSGAGDNTSITIVDNDVATVFVTASDDTARENNASGGTFVVSRVGRLDVNLLVSYTLEGTATAGGDFPALTGTVLIPSGRATVNIPVACVNDGAAEGEESIIIRLSSSPFYNVGNPGSAVITIIDDDVANIQLTASDSTAAEATLEPGAFTFTRVGGSFAAPLVVHFAVNGTATRGADYTDIPNSITIPAGAPSFVLTITPINDSINEGSERVTLSLLPSPDYSLTTVTPVTVTITSDDTGLFGIGFTAPESSGHENVTGPQLSVLLSGSATEPVSVNYAVTGGSATGGGVDYTLNSGTLTMLPSTNNVPLRITVVDDTALETNETIRVTLSAPVNAVLDGTATHIYTIIDNDRFGDISVTPFVATALEEGSVAGVFRIRRSGSTISNLVVTYQVLGSASAPADYAPIPSSITIPVGVASVDIPITPVDDATDETNETVTLNILSAPGARFTSATDNATISIIDNDSNAGVMVVTVVATDPIASEPGANTGTFTLSRTGDIGSDLDVSFTIAGAASASDYTAISTTATIPAGSAATTITITPLDDALFETNETVVLALTQISAYQVGVSALATVVIEDNEVSVSIVSDGNSSEDGSATGSFVLTRTGSTESDLTVNFSLSGTATRTNDYANFGLSVVIPAGADSVAIPVTAVNDSVPEGIETVVATLAGGAYSIRAPNSATVLILDDEPVLTISATDNTANEGGGDGQFTITRTGSTAADLSVFLTITGSAFNGIDYAAISTSAIIAAGAASTTLAVTPIDDDEVEVPENIIVTLNTNAAYALGSPSSATVTLVDNEINLPPTIEILSPTADVIFLPSTVPWLVLESLVSDDGRPATPGVATSLWSRVSGPGGGIATFTTPGSSNAFVRFSLAGVYVLRLTAGDGQLSSTRDLTVVVNPNAAFGSGLLAHWRFDDLGGTTAADSSGNARNGTLNGATFTTAGRFNNAVQFDGIDDVVTYNSPAATQISFSAWFLTTGDGESTTPRVIATPAYNVRIRRDDNAIALESERNSGSAEWRSELDSLSDNTWHHVVVTYDSATGAAPAMYIDGRPQIVTTLLSSTSTHLSNQGPGFIGNSGGLSRTLLGSIDEVRMYNRVLSPGEAFALSLFPPTNSAPLPNAGFDRTITLADSAVLSGTVADDGQTGTLSNRWVKFSGPGTVTFTNEFTAATSATFSEAGAYVLSLHATDGEVKVFDQATVTVVNPPTIQVQTSITPASEFAPTTAGRFTIARPIGNFATTVRYTLSGTASNGVDYTRLTNQVVIASGQGSAIVNITPAADSLAEGDESVVITLDPHPTYVIGVSNSASLVLVDRPYDGWRFGHFTSAELGDPLLAGDTADFDADRFSNLLEYALHRDPKTTDTNPGFTAAIEDLPAPNGRSLVATYTRRKAPRDINYTVEVSSNLLTWSSGAGQTLELGATDEGNGITETVRVRVISDLSAMGQRFIRLKVVKQ